MTQIVRCTCMSLSMLYVWVCNCDSSRNINAFNLSIDVRFFLYEWSRRICALHRTTIIHCREKAALRLLLWRKKNDKTQKIRIYVQRMCFEWKADMRRILNLNVRTSVSLFKKRNCQWSVWTWEGDVMSIVGEATRSNQWVYSTETPLNNHFINEKL